MATRSTDAQRKAAPKPTGAIKPLQARSRRTVERIVAAAIELVGNPGGDRVSVADIASKAGVSIGSFYGRFASIDALWQYLQGSVLDAAVARARDALDKQAAERLTASEVVHTYVAIAVGVFRKHCGTFQQIALRSRTSPDPAFRLRILELNTELHDLFRERLYERLEQIDHPDARPAIDIGLTAISAVMREYVLFAEFRPQFAAIDDDKLIEELSVLFNSYLRITS